MTDWQSLVFIKDWRVVPLFIFSFWWEMLFLFYFWRAPWIWIAKNRIGWMTVPASTHTQWCAGSPGKTKMQMRSLPSPKRTVWRCRSLWKTRLAHRSLHVARLWGSKGQHTPAKSHRNSSRKWTGCPTTWWKLQISNLRLMTNLVSKGFVLAIRAGSCIRF